jgi:uncharacterized protein (DUF1778 family)
MKTAEPKIPLNVHIPVSLKQDIETAADIAGQTLTVWVSRTLDAALRSAMRPTGSPQTAPSD